MYVTMQLNPVWDDMFIEKNEKQKSESQSDGMDGSPKYLF
jgi:hypothetical protein